MSRTSSCPAGAIFLKITGKTFPSVACDQQDFSRKHEKLVSRRLLRHPLPIYRNLLSSFFGVSRQFQIERNSRFDNFSNLALATRKRCNQIVELISMGSIVECDTFDLTCDYRFYLHIM